MRDIRALGLLLLLCSFVTYDVRASANMVAVASGLQEQLHSDLLKEDREYYVSLPRSYQDSPDRKYPLLLTFDAEALFRVSASLVDSLSSSGAIPEMVVVSIKNTDRWRDLTPIADANFPTSGGGAKFLDFVADELIPELERKWRVGNYRILAGHSLGGLMAYYDLAHGRRSFDAYLAISPTLSILEGHFDGEAKKLVSPREDGQRYAYFAMSNESGDQPYFERLQELAKNADSRNLKFEDLSLSDDHHSIRAPALLSGLRWLFADYRLLPYQLFQMTDRELSVFYDKATKKFKAPIELNVMELTNAAYWGLESPKYRQRALSLFELAIAKWPTDAYAWSCMAEGFERTGDVSKAKEAVQKAVDFGKASGFADMAYLEAMKSRIDTLN